MPGCWEPQIQNGVVTGNPRTPFLIACTKHNAPSCLTSHASRWKWRLLPRRALSNKKSNLRKNMRDCESNSNYSTNLKLIDSQPARKKSRSVKSGSTRKKLDTLREASSKSRLSRFRLG